jgi:hypothetical protein
MLGTQRARSTGPAFALGWLAGLTVVGAVVLVIASGSEPSSSGEPATWVGVLKLVLGLLFLLLAGKQWRGRPQPGQDAELAPLGIYFALGTEAKRILDDLKAWMGAHNAAIITVLLLVLGAKLTGDGIGGLSS